MLLASIIGIGNTRYGVLESTFAELVQKAATAALKDAGLGPEDIDALYLGNFAGDQFISQNHLASYAASCIGLKGIPASRLEGACASGSLALREAILGIRSGMFKRVLVVGVEKMSTLSTFGVTKVLAQASNYEWEANIGMTFPVVFGLIAQRHMYKYGITREQIASVAVKNHTYSLLIPK